MEKALYFIPECYVDTNLVETFLSIANCPVDRVNHQHGCNNVTTTMINNFSNQFAVGVIDNDKKTSQYVNAFVQIGTTAHIQFLQHPINPHFLILISPAMDQFIIDMAAEEKVDMTTFGFSSDLKNFTQQTKCIDAKSNPDLKNLFKAIQKNKECIALKNILKYLKQNTYSSTTIGIQNILNEE